MADMERISDPIVRSLFARPQLVYAEETGGKTTESPSASPDCNGLHRVVASSPW